MPECSFDPYAETLTEPEVWSVYADLQARCPVAHSPERGGFWMVSRFDDVRAALKDPETFSSAWGHRVPTTVEHGSIPINFDPPLHTQYRKLMTPFFTPSRVRELRPRLAEVMAEMIGRFRRDGGGDFVSAVALPFPLQVLVELLGFSEDTVSGLRELTEGLWAKVADFDYADAMQDIFALMRKELAEHRTSRRDDFVTSLLDATVDDRPLTEDEQCRMLSALAVAGHETTMNSMSTLVFLLVSDPALQQRMRARPELAPHYVDEMLRLRTPAQNFARKTTREVEIGGVTIPEGDAVLLSYAAANRDPAKFPDPDRFDPDRDTRGHLGFGWGIHQCLGSVLARAELTVLLETLAAQPPVRAAGEAKWSPLHGGHHLGPVVLPVRFETEESGVA
ncbi:cytochrome P450 [Amycolatopsis sp. WGS_07]|uniref:cytochrome P450 n=1 Tax=Amycolatopsis sp. WGS_07 TaxID=3076764 RepID=UPI003872BE98